MPHFLISAAHKSSGKTTISLGLCAALRRRGLSVQPFKKGPDYIDPMWLSLASGRACYNLDFNTMGEADIACTFDRYARLADVALVEGNMGLFDGTDLEGSNSKAALAALLCSPVVLVFDSRGMTRTAAALVLGLQQFDPRIRLGGVILNKVAGARHESKLRAAIEHYTDVPLLGAVQRDTQLEIDERHLGLIPSNKDAEAESKLDYIATRIAEQVDLEGLLALAGTAPVSGSDDRIAPLRSPSDIRIGIARDAAFGFYYPDDLERLEEAGAELIPFSPIRDSRLPEVDGLFIGGGFPETMMGDLEANTAMRADIRESIEAGMPVYAECGGLMYLSRSIRWDGRSAEMVGVIPADAVMHRLPVGRGYIRLRENAANPWRGGNPGDEFNAHEFHYSSLENLPDDMTFAYEVLRGKGVTGRQDGIVYKNLLANYAHLRDVEGFHWTGRFVDFVREKRTWRLSRVPRMASAALDQQQSERETSK